MPLIVTPIMARDLTADVTKRLRSLDAAGIGARVFYFLDNHSCCLRHPDIAERHTMTMAYSSHSLQCVFKEALWDFFCEREVMLNLRF